METLRRSGILILQLFILGSFFMISSCGGGGGGSGPGPGPTGVTYNGVTTQAFITADNANKIFAVIWNGGPSAASAESVSLSLSVPGVASSANLKYAGLIKELKDRAATDFASFVARSKNYVLKADVNETMYGSVSGTLTITGSIDQYTITGVLYMDYKNYNNGDGYTYDGIVTFNVNSFNIMYGRITDGTMSFTLWTIKSANGNVSLTGSIKVQESFQNNSDTLDVNMDGRDNNTSDTFRFQNFMVAFFYTNILNPSSETEALSGRVYVGAYGYVDVTTTSPLVYSSYTQDYPDSGGPIIMAGAGNSKAAVTSISTSYVKIEVDADGNSLFESQNAYAWNNLAGAAISTSSVLTQDATNIADTTATLNGTFTNPAGFTTTVWFEYGSIQPYPFTTAQQTYGAAGSIPVSANITGLTGTAQYHFRLVAQNSMGTFYGDDKTFTTTSGTTGTTVYAILLGVPLPQSVYTFDITTPNNLTLLGSGTIPFYNYALGFDVSGNTLYAMDTASFLGTIDKSTGTYTQLGSVSGILANHSVDGLATDPTTGTIYIVSSNGFTGSSALYTLDPVARVATLIGTQSAVNNLVELASDLAGNLYTTSLDTDSLYKFDKLNGQVSLIGALGQDIIGQQGMAFDQSTGLLYGIIGNRDLANYAFGTINMTTGAFTASVSTGGVRKIAIAPVP